MKIFFLIIAGFILSSCTRRQTNHQNNETPKSLDDKKSYSLISKRGQTDMVESLYDELVSEKAELKQLENEIDDLHDQAPDSLSVFENFNSKNNKYYSSAKQHVDQIKDSVLKEKMKMIIRNSQTNYDNRIAALSGLVNQLNDREITLNDYHLILKLNKTLTMIEGFQKNNLPSIKPIGSVISKYNKLIQKTDSLLGNDPLFCP